ncbi:hypothetical protein WME99_37635 [Sorangium sp. So ce136]|uniref:hypothetical protein n=1 Tax=Sorangium sp. So ce136 TaxID=3133284 RepID=UPI003F107E56
MALEWTLTFSDIKKLANTGGHERTEAEHRAPLEVAGRCGKHARETPSFHRIFEAVRA